MGSLSLTHSFVYREWLCHTNFSFLAGASHPFELIDRATDLGLSGIGITDFDGVYGLARSYVHWRGLDVEKRPALFYGAEVHLTQDHQLPIPLRNTLVLIARSAVGYANLCQLITRSRRESKHNAVVSLADLAQSSLKDVSAIAPMRGLIRQGQRNRWMNQLISLRDLFANDLHLAVSRHLNPGEDCWIQLQIAAAQQLQLPILLSQDVFFHDRSRKPLSDVLHAIRTNLKLGECVDHMFINDERTLLSPQDFHNRYRILPCYHAALEASAILAEQCNFSFAELRYQYPKEMIPEGHSAQSYLEQLTWQSARGLYGEQIPPHILQLIEHELRLIAELGFADYFLTVWEIVDWARSHQILCQGRGSAANSAICFVLGITAVDPSEFDLLFERFMSRERGDPPDIDVDFENERREEVIQHIYERYGRDKAAMVANVITFRRKGAMRSVGKALGVPEVILSEGSDMSGSRIHAGKSLQEVAEVLKEEFQEEQIPWQLWVELTETLKGFPRHLGIHSGGFMIADRPLHHLVPVEPATMEGRTVIQWCKDDIEDLGFFKIDILALGMLTAMRKMFAMVKQHYGRDLNMYNLPQRDPATFHMIQKAETVGVFQIESRAQMSMLPRMLPRTMYDLVIEVALIRPGPIQGGMIHPFLRRRHGLEPVTFPDERLKPILQRTLGIPIFQEQVMRIAMAVGNFTPGEANELRKNMGAWSMRGDLNPWLAKLAEGMAANGLSPDFAQSILAQMKGFAEYGFPESHSVSFALIAYASSYFKCHYPAVFFTALLNSQPMGFYAPHVLLQTAKHAGVVVLPISVHHSHWDCTLEIFERDGKKYFAVRLGFRMISGMRQKTADHIAEKRQTQGPWGSWQDFLKGTNLLRHELTILAAADALTPLGLDRRAAIWMAAAAPHSCWLEDVETPLGLAAESLQEQVQQDFRATSTSLVGHPAQLIRETAWCYGVGLKQIKLASSMEKLIPNQVITVFGMVIIRQRPPSANGMMFITIEDETGFVNLVFTPDITEKFAAELHGKSMLCVSGKLQKQGLAHSLMVRHVFAPLITQAEVIPMQSVPMPHQPSPLDFALQIRAY